MKKVSKRVPLTALILAFFGLSALTVLAYVAVITPAFADEAVVANGGILEGIEKILQYILPFFEGYAGFLPQWVIGVLAVIGTFRLIFKPVFAVVEAVVAQTPSTRDDEVVSKFKNSKAYAFVVFLLDYLASIKLKKKQ